MANQLTSIIPLLFPLVGLTGLLLAVGLVFFRRRALSKYRRTPLSRQLLRPAGHGINVRISQLRNQVDQYALELLLMPFSMLTAYNWHSTHSAHALTVLDVTPYLVVTVIHFIWRTCCLVAVSRNVDRLYLALDAEMAVGQELDQLMRQGAAVFHDFPAQYGNIDHVVITRNAVFAVETKGRSKAQYGLIENDYRVTYDGQVLIFPNKTETRPLKQSQQQSQWLARWLRDAVGVDIAVMPVVALPGWHVDQQGRGPVLVISGRKPNILTAWRGQPMSDALFHRIAHAVEERCRTLELKSQKRLPDARSMKATQGE